MRNRLLLSIGFALFLAGILPAQEPSPVRVAPQGLLFDFQDADLRFVLSALAEAAHLNLIYSDLPSRHVTLRTNQPVAPDQIMPLLRSLASSNGLKLIEDGAFIRVEDAGARAQRGAAPKDTTSEPEVRLFVYRLKHARAARLATTLQTIFGAGPGARPGLAAARPSRTLSQELREQQIAPTEPQQPPAVTVQLGPTPAATPSLPGRLRGEIQIVADEATNSLLIRAQPADWEVLKQSIETLDLRPLQVLIEVLIAEVRHTTDFQLGVSGRVGPALADSSPPSNVISGSLTGASAGDFVLRVMRVGRVDMDLALSALSSKGTVRIVSRPVLLAQNNQEARILIGTERPFVQVFRSLPTNEAVRDQVVQYRDVGTQLTLTPTINEDGYVNLQVSQQVSTATTEVQFGAPVISTREAATHLFVRDGQTVVIGGLVDREQDRIRSGIPILKDIPLLGLLFGSTQRKDIQNELFLFVTPHIIANDADAERAKDAIHSGSELLRPVLPKKPLVEPAPAARDTVP